MKNTIRVSEGRCIRYHTLHIPHQTASPPLSRVKILSSSPLTPPHSYISSHPPLTPPLTHPSTPSLTPLSPYSNTLCHPLFYHPAVLGTGGQLHDAGWDAFITGNTPLTHSHIPFPYLLHPTSYTPHILLPPSFPNRVGFLPASASLNTSHPYPAHIFSPLPPYHTL